MPLCYYHKHYIIFFALRTVLYCTVRANHSDSQISLQHPVSVVCGHGFFGERIRQAQVEHVKQRVSKHEGQQHVNVHPPVGVVRMLLNERQEFRHGVYFCLNEVQPSAYGVTVVVGESKHLQELGLVQHVRIDFVVGLILLKCLVCAHEIGFVHGANEFDEFNTINGVHCFKSFFLDYRLSLIASLIAYRLSLRLSLIAY
jgi:hypothetical protein